MGVSGLLRHVIKKYPSIHLPAPNPLVPVHYLFIDFNAFIYDTINAFPTDVVYDFTIKKDVESYEKRLVALVIENTIHLVNKVIKPQKLLYIAIDGPPPLSKMEQQRERRYKHPYMDKLKKNAYPLKTISGMKYDQNRITPGTPLMESFNKEFKKAIKANKFGKISVVYDGSDIVGEAEHKYMRMMEKIEDGTDDNFVVISSDGDVILLLLRFIFKNVWIMISRSDKIVFDKLYPEEQRYVYVDCKKLADCIYGDSFEQARPRHRGGKLKISNSEEKLLTKMKVMKTKPDDLMNKKLLYLLDYVFMSFLEGNDFVKTIYFLKFKEDNMRTLLSAYNYQRRIDRSMRLIHWKNNNLFINQRFLMAILKRLSDIESERIQAVRERISRNLDKPNMNNKNKNNKGMEHIPFSNKKHILHKNYVREYDVLFKNLKKSYYEYFWDGVYDVEKICDEYLTSLITTIRYYFGTEIYWRTYYNGLVAPLPSDLFAFLAKRPNYFETLKLEVGEPVSPLVLLAFVLPPQSMTPDIFPKKYKDALIKEHPEFFPEKIQLKLLQPGGKLIYAEPNLNNPTLEFLEETLKKTKLTKAEEKRNTLVDEPYVKALFSSTT
jgi:5'-3' exonuclease